MSLKSEYESLIHLIARAFAKTHGSEDPTTYADTVVEHAKAESEKDDTAKQGE